ncbi:MAG: HlyD family efflux transporter periplasmic adaptor subunit, partial [Acetobacteraceae bacterium]|nr:HlyD family efflux transporter periplasmic adaptor subunit [Acetobacteraceae bacterium]
LAPGADAPPRAEDWRRSAKRRRFRGRNVLLLAALFGLVVLLAILFGPEAQPVDTAAAARADMIVTVSSEGKTRVKQQYDVNAPVGGRLRRVPLKAGADIVGGETVLATIEPPAPQFNDARSQTELLAKVRAAESALAQAEADLIRARSQLDFAEKDVVRYRDLAAQGVTAQRSLSQYVVEADTRRAALAVANKMVEQRQAELEQAHASLIGPAAIAVGQPMPVVEVRAPVTGRVLDVQRESETVINQGQPIMTVGDVRDIEVMLEMLSEDAVKVRPGMRAFIEGWGGTPLNARVRLVEPFSYTKVSALGIEEQRVHVLLDFTDPLEKWQAMGHGYRVTGKVVTWEGKDTLTLPMGALFRDGTRWAVYTVDDHVARLRHVELGHLNENEAEVVGGIPPGAEVILHPSDRIADGIPVRPRT